jgi:hypothetical protein
LRAFSCLRAANVIAILVVNIDTIELLVIHNSDKACGDLFLLSKTVVPAVIVITCVKNGHRDHETKHHFKYWRRTRYQALPDQDPPMPAPPKLRMTFFPAALKLSTRPWLFALLQIASAGATLHCTSQAFLVGAHVYETAKAMTTWEYASN